MVNALFFNNRFLFSTTPNSRHGKVRGPSHVSHQQQKPKSHYRRGRAGRIDRSLPLAGTRGGCPRLRGPQSGWGRILTAKIGGHLTELGGLNIADGGRAKNIRRLAKELGLELTGTHIRLTYSYFNGREMLPQEEMLKERQFQPKNLEAQLTELVQKSQNMRDILNGVLKEEDPLHQLLSVRLAGYEGGSIDELSSYYATTLYHMLLGGVSSAHPSEAKESLSNWVRIKGGNALLPEKIAQKLGRRLHLNKPLKKVSKDPDGYRLAFSDDQYVKADKLLLAIPCSVYNEIIIEENVLSSKKKAEISNVHYGTNAKIMIPFTKAPSEKIAFFNDRMGCFFEADCNILTLYLTGESSRFSPSTIFQAYCQERPMIEMAYGELCPPLMAPLTAKDESFTNYECPVGHSWPNDPYAKGSYSCISPGQERLLTATQVEHGEIVKKLFAPIDQQLYFAGEHTSILVETSGTMEAACESGERTARMILKAL